ncbi:hypothetical protein GCM10010431_24740 [Streptomyces kunmingensis]
MVADARRGMWACGERSAGRAPAGTSSNRAGDGVNQAPPEAKPLAGQCGTGPRTPFGRMVRGVRARGVRRK